MPKPGSALPKRREARAGRAQRGPALLGKREIITETIDFIVTWVDGNDPEWRAERARCLNLPEDLGAQAVRYRDWDTLQYLFRAFEKFTPWVNRVHFVTWGHLPPWLNTACPKLNIVNHRDYIPEEYLPTFSSHPLEFNAHRIPGLADRFVLFNDDMFVTKPMPRERFFKNGLPADFAVLCPFVSKVPGDFFCAIVANDTALLNAHFKKRRILRRNFFKYINLRYGWELRYTLASLVLPDIVGFWRSHYPQPYLKSTLEAVWEKEYAVLDRTCRNKVRAATDVNIWAMRYWQLAEGAFTPSTPHNRHYFALGKNVDGMLKAIRNQTYDLICLNDNAEIGDIAPLQQKVMAAFDAILPEKSSFEK